ncbi:MAG: hypothetical protein KDD46_08770, partial [Bdellovibrionales bacterium]|nr:hypothetical protein [Bdellovibrionales bacterium]
MYIKERFKMILRFYTLGNDKFLLNQYQCFDALEANGFLDDLCALRIWGLIENGPRLRPFFLIGEKSIVQKSRIPLELILTPKGEEALIESGLIQ